MKQIKIMLWYDVEDYITPESDDALLALINMMDRLGVRSSLKIVGEKIRALKSRARFDVLDKLANHEICYHTETHSQHPTQTEYLQGLGFAEGAQEFEKRERAGFDDVQNITGQFPTSYGQPGGSWAPHVFPVLRKWGIPTYLDSHDLIDVYGKPFHYGGVLNLTRLQATMRLEYEDGGLDEAKKRFDEICRSADGLQFVSIYYHPCEFSCTQFWDGVNFRKGANPPRSEWKGAPLRTPEEMHRRVNLLGEFLQYTLEKENVEYITAQQSCLYEHHASPALTLSDVFHTAAACSSGPDYALCGGRSLCASELLSLFARCVLRLPLVPELSYGPEEDIPSLLCEPSSPAALAQAFREQYSRVLGYKQLPVRYQVDRNFISPIDLFMNLRRAILEGLPADQPMQLTQGEGSLRPVRHINTGYDWSKGWIIFPDDLDASNIVKHAMLQTWTLKPAVF